MSSVSFLVFLPALDGQWLNWDDETNFVENPHYRGLGPAQLRWMFTTTQLAVYIPLSWMTLGLKLRHRRDGPVGYHPGNLLWHDSERLWRVAVAVDPSCLICRMNLGNALLKRGHAAEAEEHVRQVIASRPALPQPYDSLGVALAAQGRYPEAEAAFRQALRRSPDQGLTLANLGRLYTDQGRWLEALPLLRRALHARPRPPHVDILAGRACAAAPWS